MTNLTLKLAILTVLFSNITCFANNTEHILKISDQHIPSLTVHITDAIKDQNLLHDTLLNEKSEAVTMSILEFIKEHADPYKKKNEAQGSWIKSTKWIKDPNWIKRELA